MGRKEWSPKTWSGLTCLALLTEIGRVQGTLGGEDYPDRVRGVNNEGGQPVISTL